MELEPIDVTEFELIETKPASLPPNRLAQLSQGLLWFNERAWPLGIVVLLTAGMYLYQYIYAEKIPLSITSSAVIGALPAMSAMLIFIISVLAAFILMPIFILFHRLNDSGKRLSDDFHFDNSSPEQTVGHRRLILRWAFGLLMLGSYCVAVSALGAYVSGPWWIGLGIAGAVLTIAAYTAFITRGVGIAVSADFRFACVMSAFVQGFVILNVTIVALRVANEYVSHIAWLIPLMFFELVALWLIQLLGAMFVIKMHRHENPVAFVATAVMIMVIVFGLYPPTGAKLGGFALQVSASGGRNCTIMNFAPETKTFEAISDPAKPGYSRPLRVIAEVDGTYFVRLWKSESKAVQFVSRASLVGVDECQSSKHGQSPG